MLTAPSAALLVPADHADAYNFLAFNQGTGELLSHAHKAIFALAQADLREPHKPIEILKAGVAGKNLWQNQTPLPLARTVVDMLMAPWNLEQTNQAGKRSVS
jgi:hypothetical protein